MQTQTLTVSDIRHFDYPLTTLVEDKVYSLYDLNVIKKEVIDRIKSFQVKIERPVVITDVFNAENPNKINELLTKHKNLLVIFLPNTENIVKQHFGDLTFFTFSLDGKDKHIVPLHFNQIANRWPLILDDIKLGNSYYLNQEQDYTNSFKLFGEVNRRTVTNKALYVGKNFVVAYVDFFGLNVNNTNDKDEVVAYMFEWLEDYYNSHKEIFNLTEEERKISKTAKSMVDFFNYLMENRKTILRKKIKDNQTVIKEIYQRACKLERENGETATVMRSLQTKVAKELREFYTMDNIKSNLTSLMGDGGYSDIRFEYPNIHAETNPISITSYGKSYLVGSFNITINLETFTIQFVNIDNSRQRRGDTSTTYDHPHVNNHVACFGNMKEHINKLVVENDIVVLLQTLIIFLKEYNDGRFGGQPFVMLEEHWGEEGDWNRDYQLPTRHPRCIERVARETAEQVARRAAFRTAHPSLTVSIDDTCSECDELIIDCLENDNCDRNDETGDWN